MWGIFITADRKNICIHIYKAMTTLHDKAADAGN